MNDEFLVINVMNYKDVMQAASEVPKGACACVTGNHILDEFMPTNDTLRTRRDIPVRRKHATASSSSDAYQVLSTHS